MHPKALFGATLLLVSGASLAGDEFPARMEGKWRSALSGAGGDSVVELVKAESTEKSQVKVDMGAVPNGHGGTCYIGKVSAVAERVEGAWTIKVPHPRCPIWTFKVNAVEGKNRLEGSFITDVGQSGNIAFDWK